MNGRSLHLCQKQATKLGFCQRIAWRASNFDSYRAVELRCWYDADGKHTNQVR